MNSALEAFRRGDARHLFYFGDVLAGLKTFLSLGELARVAYLDPPFLTGKNFSAYRDDSDLDTLMNLIREAVMLCRDALAGNGSLYLHIDYRLSARCRLMLDEIFGADHFLNEIIWVYQSGGRSMTRYSRKHDTIFLYRKGARALFQPLAVGTPRFNVRTNHMRRGIDEKRGSYSAIHTSGKEYRYYDHDLVPPSDVWTDISHLQQRDPERTGYPTQKPLRLLERVILASSHERDIILDPFCGSGTTLAAAERTGRRGFGIDNSPAAWSTVQTRLSGTEMAVIMELKSL